MEYVNESTVMQAWFAGSMGNRKRTHQTIFTRGRAVLLDDEASSVDGLGRQQVGVLADAAPSDDTSGIQHG